DIKDNRRNPEIGELYRSISVDNRDFSVTDDKLSKKKQNSYVRFCKQIYTNFPNLGQNAKYSEEFENSIQFLKWDLKAEEYNACIKFILILGIFLGMIVIGLCYYFLLPKMSEAFGNTIVPILIIFGIPLVAVGYVFMYMRDYPISKVKEEKIKALTFVPEIVGYLIMSMKLVPNLEKAIEFASNHGHGKIAEDLQILLWEVKVGIKNSVSEALDELAYKWGDVSEELKKALMKIRASVIEVSEAKRYQLLDQTMSDTLVSIKGKLEDYARSLSNPAMIMFYLGILLPLLLIIVLPVGSAFSGSALAKPIYLILIYNIILPISCIIFANNIIKNRPATYIPPVIPNNHPDLPPKNTIVIGKANISLVFLVILILFGGIFASYYAHNIFGKTRESVLREEGLNVTNPNFSCSNFEKTRKLKEPNYKCESEVEFWSDKDRDITPYILIYGVILSIAFSISLWLYGTSVYKRKVQNQVIKMEDEFKDALYIIASRLGENKPIEDAMEHTRIYLPKSIIAQNIFGRAIDNIKILGLTLHSALFDNNYGALKNNPSNVINSAMQLLTDSVQLGVSVAAKTLMSYSMQLRNSDEVSKMLSGLIVGITGTLSSMAKYIAPVVLGITTALQKIVISTLKSIASSGTMEEMNSAMQNMSSADLGGAGTIDAASVGNSLGSLGSINTQVISQLASPTVFLIIVAIYVIEIVIIITYFTTMIEEDNTTLVKLRIAQTLPIAVILFIVTVILSNMIF
ncbi:MAG: hypothetical protein V1824_00070, partial [archaeon]